MVHSTVTSVKDLNKPLTPEPSQQYHRTTLLLSLEPSRLNSAPQALATDR